MAPAAVDTIEAHLKERNIDPSYYDLIVTGDLGRSGMKFHLIYSKSMEYRSGRAISRLWS